MEGLPGGPARSAGEDGSGGLTPAPGRRAPARRIGCSSLSGLPAPRARACGAAGSAPAWHAGGQGFESPQVHQKCLTQTTDLSKCNSASAGVSFRNMGEPAGISGLLSIGRDLPGGFEFVGDARRVVSFDALVSTLRAPPTLTDLAPEERVEGGSELCLDGDAALCGVVDDDQNLLEERLVEHSPSARPRPERVQYRAGKILGPLQQRRSPPRSPRATSRDRPIASSGYGGGLDEPGSAEHATYDSLIPVAWSGRPVAVCVFPGGPSVVPDTIGVCWRRTS